MQLSEKNELMGSIASMAMLDLTQMNVDKIIKVLLDATNQIHEIRQ
jgi:hypothetical protein